MAAIKQTVKIVRTTGTGSYSPGMVVNNSGSFKMLNFTFNDSNERISKYLLGGVLVSDNSSSLSTPFQLLLFNDNFTISDSASFNPNQDQMDGFLGSIVFDNWVGLVSNKFSEGKTIKPTVVDAGDIYGVLIAQGSYTPINQETFLIKLDLENQ